MTTPFLMKARSNLGLIRSKLEARQIKTAGEITPPIDHNELLLLVDAVYYILEELDKRK